MKDVLVKTSQALPVTSMLTALLQTLAAQATVFAKLQRCSIVQLSKAGPPPLTTAADPCTKGKQYAGIHRFCCSHLLLICMKISGVRVHSLQLHKVESSEMLVPNLT